MNLHQIDNNLSNIDSVKLAESEWKSFALKALASLRTMVDADKKYIERLEKMNDLLMNQLGTTKEELE
jgi:hypothetical protein